MELDVAIIGAGIAGLGAAIALRRAGHKATVYERSACQSEFGAAIMIPPHAGKILRAWGVDAQAEGGTILTQRRTASAQTGELIAGEDFGGVEKTYGEPFLSFHRADLQRALWKRAERLEAGIQLSSKVMDINCESGTVTLADGRIPQFDLVIVADGIFSSFISAVAGPNIISRKSGLSAHRTLIPIARLKKDPKSHQLLRTLDESNGRVSTMFGASNLSKKTLFVSYPCRNGEALNIAIIHPIRQQDGTSSDQWNSLGDVQHAVTELDGFHDLFKQLIQCADDVRTYTLDYRDPLPRYVNGRAIIVGDAAHPMLPLYTGGGSTALEDAAALEVLLSDLPRSNLSTSQYNSDSILHSRLMLWQAIRHPRNSVIQTLSNTMFLCQNYSTASVAPAIRQYCDEELPPSLPPGWAKPTREYFCSYDAFGVAKKALDWAERDSSWVDAVELCWSGNLPAGVVKHFGDQRDKGQKSEDETEPSKFLGLLAAVAMLLAAIASVQLNVEMLWDWPWWLSKFDWSFARW